MSTKTSTHFAHADSRSGDVINPPPAAAAGDETTK